MKIVNLIEDTKGEINCLYEHGLSFYIETKNHRILMDTGASDAFINNAKKLKIDLTKVDLVILSHGHYDHCGGVLSFVKINPQAKIYIQKTASNDYYSIHGNQSKYIGIDKRIWNLKQLVLVDEMLKIDEEVMIFAGVQGRKYWPEANKRIMKKVAGNLVQDDFIHEQYLVVKDNDQQYLFSGCGHNGIINILTRYHQIFAKYPNFVISGFHMIKKEPYNELEIETIEKTGELLKQLPTVFYTGHCTGIEAIRILKKIMENKLQIIHSGMEIFDLSGQK